MITCSDINFQGNPGTPGDCAFGNKLFRIASTIGIAVKNGYDYGFPKWDCQKYFENELPTNTKQFKKYRMPATFHNLDFGFVTFNIPDGRDLRGELASYKYFEHCDDLIKNYFTLKPQCETVDDYILMHYRNYNLPDWINLPREYYKKALKVFPHKPVLVVTDNVDAAYKAIGPGYEYTSNTPIVDFYLLCNTDYLVMGNSTFSWWASYLSDAVTVAPSLWYKGVLKYAPKDDLYLPDWTII